MPASRHGLVAETAVGNEAVCRPSDITGRSAAGLEPTRSEPSQRLIRLLLGGKRADSRQDASDTSRRSSSGWADWDDAFAQQNFSGQHQQLDSTDTSAFPDAHAPRDADRRSPSQMSVWLRVTLRLRHMAQGAGQAIRTSPLIILIPMLLTMVMMALGVFAVVRASSDYVKNQQESALGFARGAGLGMATQFQLALNPCATLEACVVEQPNFPLLNQSWARVGERVFSKLVSGGTVQLELAPFGRVFSLYPFSAGDEKIMGYDCLGPNARPSDVTSLTRAIVERSVVINFKQLLEGGYGAVIYYPVFINDVNEDETFGLDYAPTPCPGCVFYNAINRTKWWGAVIAVVLLDPLLVLGEDSRLAALIREGYDYKLILPPAGGLVGPAAAATSTASETITNSTAHFTAAPVSVTVDMPDGQVWIMQIAPHSSQGWEPSWRTGLIVMVVVLSLLVGVLVFVVMLSNHQYQDLVWNMLPKRVVRCLQLGQSYAEPFSNVTILFSDIVSYTNMSSEMTPFQLVDLLNRVYSHFDGLCEKHGVFKVETIGDAFVAVAGCPARCPPREAARKVATMALDMLDFIEGFVNPDGRRIRIRVGLYSGDITAAVVGSKMQRMTMIGDTVNVASRMETNSAPQRCHIGEPTARLLAGYPEFQLTSRGPIDIKGKGQMETFWLSRSDTSPEAGSGSCCESQASITLAPISPRANSAPQTMRTVPPLSPSPTDSHPLPRHLNLTASCSKVAMSLSPLGEKPLQSGAILELAEGELCEVGTTPSHQLPAHRP